MSTFWRYVKIQAFVLLCGIVGPIFLAIYFASGAQPIMKWMFWAGLAITALDVLIALGITSMGARSAAKTQALEQTGVLALAQVVGIHETGTRINEQPLVKIDLQISGPGIAPFASQDRVIASITRLPMITNRKLVALVDPDHHAVSDRLGPKRFGQWRDAGDLHDRRGQQDLRPQRTGRAADGDPADPQGQQHRPEQHDRSALESGGPPTGAGRRAACGGRSRLRRSCGRHRGRRPRRRSMPPRRRNRRRRSGCRNWRRCAPPARSPTTNTRPSVSRSSPTCRR